MNYLLYDPLIINKFYTLVQLLYARMKIYTHEVDVNVYRKLLKNTVKYL